MIKCSCCGYECDCMDLYYDHIMFDTRHIEIAQLAAKKEATRVPRRMTRYATRSSLLIRKQKSEPAIEPTNRSLVLNAAGY
ncbi:hypothetical protein H4S00_002582 [Coemansia sp. D1744]|nr:hypothetical protein H4S00_002582 [Coemansia sp. D1744]